MNIWWAAPSTCRDLSAWFYYKWDIRKGWNGPYEMLRERGFRLLGLEVSWVVTITA